MTLRNQGTSIQKSQYSQDSSDRSVTSYANILGARIHAISWDETLSKISQWSRQRESRYVCICNVHSVVTASMDPAFSGVINQADLATPDGAPVAWALRKIGFSNQQRINGPDLMWRYCQIAAHRQEKIFLYGGTENTLQQLQKVLHENFPNLEVAGAYSPPFRPLTEAEDAEVIQKMNASGAGTVWVSLGCPKQEFWMARHRGKINDVMLGVGAAFDYHAGTIQRAPVWMRNAGLEWLHRLLSEPSRLWKRYLVTNTVFLLKIPSSIWSEKNKRKSLK